MNEWQTEGVPTQWEMAYELSRALGHSIDIAHQRPGAWRDLISRVQALVIMRNNLSDIAGLQVGSRVTDDEGWSEAQPEAIARWAVYARVDEAMEETRVRIEEALGAPVGTGIAELIDVAKQMGATNE